MIDNETLEHFLDHLDLASLPSEYIVEMRFTLSGQVFSVPERDVDQWRMNRPRGATDVKYYLNTHKIVRTIMLEYEYIMDRIKIIAGDNL